MLKLLVIQEGHLNGLLQYLIILSAINILVNSTNEPPSCIATVVPRLLTLIQQIRNESVAHCRSVRENVTAKD
jgi:hypothetical protein